jgi:hypothetical protein
VLWFSGGVLRIFPLAVVLVLGRAGVWRRLAVCGCRCRSRVRSEEPLIRVLIRVDLAARSDSDSAADSRRALLNRATSVLKCF